MYGFTLFFHYLALASLTLLFDSLTSFKHRSASWYYTSYLEAKHKLQTSVKILERSLLKNNNGRVKCLKMYKPTEDTTLLEYMLYVKHWLFKIYKAMILSSEPVIEMNVVKDQTSRLERLIMDNDHERQYTYDDIKSEI